MTEKVWTPMMLQSDIWVAIVSRLRLGPDCTLMLTLLATHRGALEWFRLSLVEQLAEMREGKEGTTSLVNRVKKMFKRGGSMCDIVDEFVEKSAKVGPKQLSLTYVSCMLRLLRYGWDGTTSLYERHDQLAGFSYYTLKPFTLCTSIDIDALQVSEIWVYQGSGDEIKDLSPLSLMQFTEAWTPVLKSREMWVHVHQREWSLTHIEREARPPSPIPTLWRVLV